MKWLDEKPSSEFRDRVFRSADAEFAKFKPASSTRRAWLWQMTAAAGLAVAAVFVFRPKSEIDYERSLTVENSDPELDLLQEMALLPDLDLWENLDLFESWQERDEDA